ncbi:MAG TPA: homoprotocatechuate degradation operon regulator HpaR [Beijerinckiaceae bacterium]|nr:homoprotocatechuate degradation operon regulator HpaR [Beijerinckiaceae bacterium]
MRPLEHSLPLKLLNAREAVMERFRPHLHANGLTEQQWRVLRALAEAEELDVGTLSRRITLLMPSLSRMLPDLEKRGLLSRRRSPQDARLMLARLTGEGQALFARVGAESERIYAAIEAQVGRQTLQELMRALDTVQARLAAPRDPAGGGSGA